MPDVTSRAIGTARHPLVATAINQLREAPYDLAELCVLARETGGMLPPLAVLWLLDEYAAREREIAALVSECQDWADESDRLKQQFEVLRLRIRSMGREASAVDHERARLEAAARSVC